MRIKYSVRGTRIKSNWLDNYERKQNMYTNIGGYKGLYLYLSLYKFKINTYESDEHTFVTSISLLQKVTNYTTVEIFNLLLRMRGSNVIIIDNISRTDQLLMNNIKLNTIEKENNNYKLKGSQIDNDKILIIKTQDLPKTIPEQKGDKIIDIPATEDDRYIHISFDIFEIYEQLDFDKRHYTLYCLINKWNNNLENKMYMSIEKMAEQLRDINKTTINKLIINMNKNYLLYSAYRKRNGKGRQGLRYEHHLANSLQMLDWIKRNYKVEIDKRYEAK